MKRRELERYLCAHGAELLREGARQGVWAIGEAESERTLPSPATTRSRPAPCAASAKSSISPPLPAAEINVSPSRPVGQSLVMLTVRARRLLEVPQLGPKAVADILAVADPKLYLENSIELLGFRCRVSPPRRDGELVGMRQHGRGVVVVNGAASSRRAQPLTAQLMPPPRRAPRSRCRAERAAGLGGGRHRCLSLDGVFLRQRAREIVGVDADLARKGDREVPVAIE